MTDDRSRRRGERAGLTRQAVLAAARDLITETGFETLTMRALARRLDVVPTALYNHATGRDDVVDALLDEVLAPLQPPTADPDPVAALSRLMTDTYQTLVAAPDLAPLFLPRRRRSGANALRLSLTTLALLRQVGLDDPQAADALRVLVVYTFGFATVAIRPTHDLGSDTPLPPERLDANFRRGLGWLLTGIATSTPHRHHPFGSAEFP